MRPGQAAPEFLVVETLSGWPFDGFNEAGAGCPGIRGDPSAGDNSVRRFNEAGAGCPGIPGL